MCVSVFQCQWPPRSNAVIRAAFSAAGWNGGGLFCGGTDICFGISHASEVDGQVFPSFCDASPGCPSRSAPEMKLTACGMACRAAKGRNEEDGLLVKVLRAHGSIPFVRGNVPQCF